MKSLLAFLTCLGLNDCNCGEENPVIWSSSSEFKIFGFMAEMDCGDIEPICSLEISSKMSLKTSEVKTLSFHDHAPDL